MSEQRQWCAGSRGWPDGTLYPADPNRPGYATCGACGKVTSCTRTPNAYSPIGMLRAHRVPRG